MLLAFDAHYTDTTTRLIAAAFQDWSDAEPAELFEWTSGPAADYQPGQFYLREMPLIVKALEDKDGDLACSILAEQVSYLSEKTQQAQQWKAHKGKKSLKTES